MGNANPYGEHLFTSTFFSDKALDWLENYCAAVRSIVGWEIPIATDHFGHMPIETFIKFARRLDKYNLAWYEDVVPWFYPDQLRRLKDSCTTPICTGEDCYLCEGFQDMFEKQAISVAHPDLANFGGILETKKLIDLATQHGVASCILNRIHRTDRPGDPIIDKGFITVPNGPGLGVELNMDVLKAGIIEGGLFEPTTQWDSETDFDGHM